MGLFSFARAAGKRLGILGSDEETSAPAATDDAARAARDRANEAISLAIEQHIAALGVPVDDFDAIYKGDGFVRVFGTTETNADREKILLTVGNLAGIEKLDDNLKVSNPEPEATFHTVERGDTLSKLAARVYGNMMLYPVIFEANRPMLGDPDEIFPGQVLRIPPLEAVTHTVRRGDTLGAIAKTYYGDVRKYTAIFEANRDVLDDPNVIRAGQVLRIPGLG